jgi:hypothetical protein
LGKYIYTERSQKELDKPQSQNRNINLRKGNTKTQGGHLCSPYLIT